MEIKEKCYEIDLKKIEDGFLFSEIFCYSENRNEAKTKLLNDIKYSDLRLKHLKDEITYLNIPIIRKKSLDKVLFEDKIILKYQLNEILEKRKRDIEFDILLEDKNITHCYIMKRGYYYMDGYCGYTSQIIDAGIYIKSDAVQHAKGCDEIILIKIKNNEHNKIINDKIEYLKTKFI